METYFAPAQRASKEALIEDIHLISENPLINSLMHFVGGLIAILNEHRQILAINESLLKYMGIDDPGEALSLRPGEFLNCNYAHKMPGGCGTSMFCSSCGVAIALMSTLQYDNSTSMTCALSTTRNGEKIELFFKVCSASILIESKRLILLFLQDITNEHRALALERVFFHDINNLIMGLLGKSELLCMENGENLDILAQGILKLASRLAQEMKIQQFLTLPSKIGYKLDFAEVSSESIFEEIYQRFSHHPLAKGKELKIIAPVQHYSFKTDITLLMRVVSNMIINALEASNAGEAIKISMDRKDKNITFSVWNKQVIRDDIQKRIFQRHFSTKSDPGRGLGTYSMKLLGEEYLGGKVDFISSFKDGTLFRFSLKTE